MKRDGFTLIEVLIAVVVLTIAVTGLGQFMAKYQHSTSTATLLSSMTSIAKERLELVRADPRYTTLTTLYGTGASADTTGFPRYPSVRRTTTVVRDQSGNPARDRTTVTVRVFATNGISRDTVRLTAVIARP
ncbi:MAG: prepilin-type N-terminal cleavage/methylation domain-containing protein [Gemmatimonadales bacterium]|nr:prepilin-type N-terminal cleavage/methylation domain-containing protein [Gemmatimonadales bacterium]